MKIRVVKLFSDNNTIYYPSNVYEVRDAVAQEYVAASLAVKEGNQELTQNADAENDSDNTTKRVVARWNRRK